MGVKNTIAGILPERLWNGIRDRKASIQLRKDYSRQRKRFERSYSREWSEGLMQMQSRLTFLTHQIEKGLGHREFRYNFGKHVFETLPALLKRFEAADVHYLDNPVYRECMSALHEYVERHTNAGVDISWQRSKFTPMQWQRLESWNRKDGGSIEILGSEKLNNGSLTFEELARNRHSLREYSGEPVDEGQLRQAIDLATRAPSACNRQAARVKMILDKEIIAKALKLQGGVNGYPIPPALLLVTADLRVYMNIDERNEGYIDGGLFGMMLLLALESRGLAACPLHTMFNEKTDEETRKLLNLPDYEIPIMYIEVGHYPETARTPKSTRLPVDRILTIMK